jgi:hypothetical protein
MTFKSDESVDIMVITEVTKAFLLMTPQRRHRLITPKYQRLNTLEATIRWVPRAGRQYYLVIENGQIPRSGAESGVDASFSLACCVHKDRASVELQPVDEQSGRGDFAAIKYRSALEGVSADELGREPTPLELRWAEDITAAMLAPMFHVIGSAFKTK